MRNRLVNLALVAIIIIALSPAIAVFWTSWFAAKHGCSVNQGFAQPCLVGGRDWGPTLASGFASGWLMLIGMPVAILAILYMLRRGIKARRGG